MGIERACADLCSRERVVRVHMRIVSHDVVRERLRHCTIQELLGHKDVETTMIYIHVSNKLGLSVKSPAD